MASPLAVSAAEVVEAEAGKGKARGRGGGEAAGSATWCSSRNLSELTGTGGGGSVVRKGGDTGEGVEPDTASVAGAGFEGDLRGADAGAASAGRAVAGERLVEMSAEQPRELVTDGAAFDMTGVSSADWGSERPVHSVVDAVLPRAAWPVLVRNFTEVAKRTEGGVSGSPLEPPVEAIPGGRNCMAESDPDAARAPGAMPRKEGGGGGKGGGRGRRPDGEASKGIATEGSPASVMPLLPQSSPSAGDGNRRVLFGRAGDPGASDKGAVDAATGKVGEVRGKRRGRGHGAGGESRAGAGASGTVPTDGAGGDSVDVAGMLALVPLAFSRRERFVECSRDCHCCPAAPSSVSSVGSPVSSPRISSGSLPRSSLLAPHSPAWRLLLTSSSGDGCHKNARCTCVEQEFCGGSSVDSEAVVAHDDGLSRWSTGDTPAPVRAPRGGGSPRVTGSSGSAGCGFGGDPADSTGGAGVGAGAPFGRGGGGRGGGRGIGARGTRGGDRTGVHSCFCCKEETDRVWTTQGMGAPRTGMSGSECIAVSGPAVFCCSSGGEGVSGGGGRGGSSITLRSGYWWHCGGAPTTVASVGHGSGAGADGASNADSWMGAKCGCSSR